MKKKRYFKILIVFIISLSVIITLYIKINQYYIGKKIFKDATIEIALCSSEKKQVIDSVKRLLIREMPECRVKNLYSNNQIQNKSDEKEIDIYMDFYIIETGEISPFSPNVEYKGYVWRFERESEKDKWKLVSWGYK